jgi:hypothetical protein
MHPDLSFQFGQAVALQFHQALEGLGLRFQFLPPFFGLFRQVLIPDVGEDQGCKIDVENAAEVQTMLSGGRALSLS